MNPNFIFLSCLLCWTAFMVQQGESVIYYTPLLAAAGTSVTVATPVLLAGCLLLKAGAVAIFALSSAGRNRGGRRHGGRRRGKREISEGLEVDEIDLEVLQKEAEAIFRQLDETDPAHCFRRYICELSSGKLQSVPEDHMAILNLVAQPLAIKSNAYEYRIAALIGEKFGKPEFCQEMYECPQTGSEIDHFFV